MIKLTGLGRTTISQLERDGEFPKRVPRPGSRGRARGHWLSDVIRWQERRKVAREV